MNSIYTRRSVRQFQDKQVETEKIEQLLRAAMQAPSAMNQQPWEFLVIQDKKQLIDLSKMNAYSTSLLQASHAIVVLANEQVLRSPSRWQQDLGASTQNLLLEATELGLGCVWLGCAPSEEPMEYIRQLFGCPKHILPYAVISVGYPKGENANYFKDYFDPKKIHYGKY